MFWDSSARVPCFVPESRSSETTALLSSDTVITIWWGTPVECSSALEAKQRHPKEFLPAPIYTNAYERLADVVAAADHVQPVDQVRDQATESNSTHFAPPTLYSLPRLSSPTNPLSSRLTNDSER